MQTKETLTTLAEELLRIANIPKCQGCSCFLDVLEQFRHTSTGNPSLSHDLAGHISNLIQNFQVTHGCLGCDPCYPVPIANALSEFGERAAPCSAQPARPVESEVWPPEPGEYLIGSKSAPVAISTLASKPLPTALAQELGTEEFALIGITETENIGIEKVVKNIVSNPNIRFLILCGQESRGHFSGQTLAALHKNGLDNSRRVVGSPVKTPFLKNLIPAQVQSFQQQIQLIDMIGCQEVPRIVQRVHRCLVENPGPFEESRGVLLYAPTDPVRRVLASTPGSFTPDKAGFFIVLLDRQAGKILLEHYNNDRRRSLVIEGKDAASLYFTAVRHRLVSRLDHAAYLGKELARAEMALRLGLDYEQDSAGQTGTTAAAPLKA